VDVERDTPERTPDAAAADAAELLDTWPEVVEAQAAIRRLQDVAAGGGNVFDELMSAVRVCALGQLTDAFFEVGGQYRRNM
jgi:methylmalonyl-CoA mutase N-terminal domain/subunit